MAFRRLVGGMHLGTPQGDPHRRDTVQELLARGAGSSPATALRLVIGTMMRASLVTKWCIDDT